MPALPAVPPSSLRGLALAAWAGVLNLTILFFQKHLFMKEMVGVRCAQKILIDGRRYPDLEEMAPKELFFLPTGAIGDLPSFAIAMTNFSQNKSAIGQFSFKTLRAALNDVGFDITPI